MKTASRAVFGLSAFLGTAGLIYVVTSRERTGGTLMLMCSVAFGYVGIILRGVARRAELREGAAATQAEEKAPELEHVGSSIWPFGYSIAAVTLAAGLVVARWLVAVGVVLFLTATIGWFVDIRHQHQHAEHP
jgi:Cytochrome c oxidase subunit IV